VLEHERQRVAKIAVVFGDQDAHRLEAAVSRAREIASKRLGRRRSFRRIFGQRAQDRLVELERQIGALRTAACR
jgi:hypothetical protein